METDDKLNSYEWKNGIEMIGRKLNETIKNLPVIIISSVDDGKDRAASLGVSRYIAKNAFNNRDLIIAVREIIGEAHA